MSALRLNPDQLKEALAIRRELSGLDAYDELRHLDEEGEWDDLVALQGALDEADYERDRLEQACDRLRDLISEAEKDLKAVRP